MANPESIVHYRLSDHAREEMARRAIGEEDVAKVLYAPEQTQPVREGRAVYQSRLDMGNPPGTYLLRVFVDTDRRPADVVTVYRTKKVAKYWRKIP